MNISAWKCRVCAILDNPYQRSGQVVAKLAVNLATMIWAAIVLYKDDALKTWPGPSLAAGEDWLAASLLLMSLYATVRLWRKSPPVMFGSCFYGGFFLLWTYTWLTLLSAIMDGITALRPGQVAGITVVVALAAFAFVSNTKAQENGNPTD